MTETDRKHYCTRQPYVDAPQSIGNGVTISAPHMVNGLFTIWKIVNCMKFTVSLWKPSRYDSIFILMGRLSLIEH